MRYIGVDLHKINFVACFLGEEDTSQLEPYPLTDQGLTTFCRRLRPTDQLAVEVAQNVYYFYDRIRASVNRVVLVDTSKFAVIAKSKTKTDRRDPTNGAFPSISRDRCYSALGQAASALPPPREDIPFRLDRRGDS